MFPKCPVQTYTESEREVLLLTTNHFCGTLQPKLEFGTRVTIEETYIRPKLTGRLNDCDMVHVIDDRIYHGRQQHKQVSKEKLKKEPRSVVIEHSPVYTNLNNRIRTALVTNQEKNFKVRQKEKQPKVSQTV